MNGSDLPTGDARVDKALRRLEELDGLEVSAHAAVYGDIQRSLAAVLDGAPPPPAEQ